MLIRVLTKFGSRIEELRGNLNKKLENIGKKQADLKNTITEIKKSTLGEINSRLANTEKLISDLKDRIVESTNQNSRKKKKIFK